MTQIKYYRITNRLKQVVEGRDVSYEQAKYFANLEESNKKSIALRKLNRHKTTIDPKTGKLIQDTEEDDSQGDAFGKEFLLEFLPETGAFKVVTKDGSEQTGASPKQINGQDNKYLKKIKKMLT